MKNLSLEENKLKIDAIVKDLAERLNRSVTIENKFINIDFTES